eukprot:COSAG02_NODE_1554_length_11948_cov_41.539455_5_plen_413_part_00
MYLLVRTRSGTRRGPETARDQQQQQVAMATAVRAHPRRAQQHRHRLSPTRHSGTRLSREEASQRLLAARSSNRSPSGEPASVERRNANLTSTSAVADDYAETLYPNMIDRERAAATYMAKYRVATGSVADKQRDVWRRQALDKLRTQGVVARLASGGERWHRPPSGAPGWLEPLAAAHLRLILALLLHGHPPPNLFTRCLLNDVDIAESIGLLLCSRAQLVFTQARHNVVLEAGGTVASGGPYAWGSALSAPLAAVGELHFAEFQLCEHSSSNECIVGVATAEFEPRGGEPFATTSTRGWGFNAWSGKHAHAGRESLPLWCTTADVSIPVAIGQTIGLLLDLRSKKSGSLTVWVDGQRQGLLCSGIPVIEESTAGGETRLGLRWLVELKSAGCHVKLRELPPPTFRSLSAAQ